MKQLMNIQVFGSQAMRWAGPWLFILVLNCYMGELKAQNGFQLAPPYLKYESVFFKKAAVVRMEFAQSGTQIHYTTNGLEPTERDPVYRKPLRIKKHNTELKAKVFGGGFLASEVVSARFYQRGLVPKNIITPPANARYPGTGITCLMDGKGGDSNLSSPNWMGFQQEMVSIEINFEKPRKIQEILLHVLENQDSWVFQPQKVDIFYIPKAGEERDSFSFIILSAKEKADKNQCEALFLKLPQPIKTELITLNIYPLPHLPEWHPGHSKPAWLFLDEVKIY